MTTGSCDGAAGSPASLLIGVGVLVLAVTVAAYLAFWPRRDQRATSPSGQLLPPVPGGGSSDVATPSDDTAPTTMDSASPCAPSSAAAPTSGTGNDCDADAGGAATGGSADAAGGAGSAPGRPSAHIEQLPDFAEGES